MTRDSNRVFVMVIGKTMNSDKDFMEKLFDSRKVCEVFTENEADFIIAFVSIVSRIGTDIEAAMKKIPASKPVVLVVLHHTFEPDYNIPDSRRHVQRDNIFTVDCLFYEGQGLLECQRNKGAIKAVQKHLEAKTSRANIKKSQVAPFQSASSHEPETRVPTSPHTSLDSNRVFVMVIGKTMNSHKNFMEKLLDSRKMYEVFTENEADFIITFVSIVSRIGTDIEAAMKKIPVSKPVVLVVLHHTFEPDYVVPDSRQYVQRDNVFTVDCLFYEDQGLLECQRNKGAIKAVQKHLEAKTSRVNIKSFGAIKSGPQDTFVDHNKGNELTNTDAVSEQRAPSLNYSNSKNRGVTYPDPAFAQHTPLLAHSDDEQGGMPNTDIESARWAQLPDHKNIRGVTYPDSAFAQHTPLLAHSDDEQGGMPNTDMESARWAQLPDHKNVRKLTNTDAVSKQGAPSLNYSSSKNRGMRYKGEASGQWPAIPGHDNAREREMPNTDVESARQDKFPDHNNARNHKKHIFIFVGLGILVVVLLTIAISILIHFT